MIPFSGDYRLTFVIVLTLLLVRYGAISGSLFVWWYVMRLGKKATQKIQPKFPAKSEYLREAGYSLLTMLTYASIVVVLYIPQVRSLTKMYTGISTMGGPVWGWVYWLFSIVLMLAIHDLYFYLMHRAVHHKKLYPIIHKVHHLSHNPTPLAAFAFHPLEAFTEFLVFPIVAFTVPHTLSALAVWMFLMSIFNAYGHLGFELYPRGFNTHPIGRWINTSVSHNMHHKYAAQNYGLYTLVWDRLFGTMHSKYDETYSEVTSRTSKKENKPMTNSQKWLPTLCLALLMDVACFLPMQAQAHTNHSARLFIEGKQNNSYTVQFSQNGDTTRRITSYFDKNKRLIRQETTVFRAKPLLLYSNVIEDIRTGEYIKLSASGNRCTLQRREKTGVAIEEKSMTVEGAIVGALASERVAQSVAKVESGEIVTFTLALPYLGTTAEMTLVKTGYQNINGVSCVTMKLEVSNFMLRTMMGEPSYFSYERAKPHRLMQYKGILGLPSAEGKQQSGLAVAAY